MKVYISNYRDHWISPYTILEKVCFWEKDKDVFYNHTDKPNAPYEKWINFLTPICGAISKFFDFVHPKIDYVKIDKWDTWSMDSTLGKIVLPMLKQLKANTHGAGFVDDEDVPEEFKTTSAPPKVNEYDIDDNHFKRWEYVMGEMIFAFESHQDHTWQDAFRSGDHDMKTVACAWDDNGKATMYQWVEGPNNTYKCDYDGMRVVEDRIKNGFRLFGKYYQNLWD